MKSIYGSHQFFVQRIDDRKIQTCFHGQSQKCPVQKRAVWKTKRDIGNTKHRMNSQLLHHFHGAQRFFHFFLLSRCCQCQTVNDDIFFSDSVFFRFLYDLFGNFKPFFCLQRDSFIQRQPDHNPAIFSHDREHSVHNLIFSVN